MSFSPFRHSEPNQCSIDVTHTKMTRINFACRFAGLGGVLAITFSGAAFACVDSLLPGQWCMVPNSHMESVEAVPPTISQSHWQDIQGNAGVKGVMQKWSGGTFDTTRNRLVVLGGGHLGYGGNEIYAFDVNTLQWARLTLPSQGPFSQQVMNDGRPASNHTYDGIEYLPPPIDRMFARGGGYYPTGNDSPQSWFFNFNSNNWEQKANFPDETIWNMGAYDPVSGVIYVQGYRELHSFNPTTNQWTYRQDSPGASGFGNSTMSIDPVRRKMVRIGDGTMHVWDLNNPSSTAKVLSTSGATEIVGAPAPGFVYDPVSDRFVAWSGGSAVYSLNMDTLVWTRHSPAAGNSVTPTAVSAEGGTFGRFQYIPSKNAFVAVNATDENVYFYKLSAGSGGNSPAAPAKPTVTIR